MSARLLIVGLEATDLGLLERHIGSGRLPVIAALHALGHLQRLWSHPGATDAALWASFHYAAEVGEHGRYHDVLKLQDGRLGLAVQDEQQRDAIWDELSCAGLRVAVFDLPKSRAPRPLNGIHLTDWLVHGRTFPRPTSYPASLADEVIARFGAAPPSRCARTSEELSDALILENLGHLRHSVSMKHAAALSYLASERWDCFLVNFREVHCCSHGYWQLIDPAHPAHEPPRAARLGDPSLGILQDIDRALGDLIDAAGPGCQLIVFSTSDFQPNGSVEHLLPQLVVQLNKHLWNHGTASLPAQSIWGVKMLPYNENACALRLATDPRAGANAAPPADGRAALIDAVQGLLQTLTDPDTGASIFEDLHRPSSTCAGARAPALPDLLLLPRSGAFPGSAVSPQLGRISAKVPRWRTGNHRAGGFVIARGERVEDAVAQIGSLAQLGRVARRVLRPLGPKPRP